MRRGEARERRRVAAVGARMVHASWLRWVPAFAGTTREGAGAMGGGGMGSSGGGGSAGLRVVVALGSRLRGNDERRRGCDEGRRGCDGGRCGNDEGRCGCDGRGRHEVVRGWGLQENSAGLRVVVALGSRLRGNDEGRRGCDEERCGNDEGRCECGGRGRHGVGRGWGLQENSAGLRVVVALGSRLRGNDEGRRGNDEGRRGNDEGRRGNDEGRCECDGRGRPGDESDVGGNGDGLVGRIGFWRI